MKSLERNAGRSKQYHQMLKEPRGESEIVSKYLRKNDYQCKSVIILLYFHWTESEPNLDYIRQGCETQ